MVHNSLINGKDETPRIVSIEDNRDGTIDVFTQDEDGKIHSETRLRDYWILTTEQVDDLSIRLEGERPFKWKNSFMTFDDFAYAKKACYKTLRAKENSYIVHDMKEQYMLSSGVTYFQGMKHSEVSVLSFDLETTTLDHNKEAKILLISNTYRDAKGNKTRKLFAYDNYRNEAEMIQYWCEWVRKQDPSIIVGHNIFNFDFPYLDYIARRNNIELTLGRNRKGMKFNSYESQFRKDGSQTIGYHRCYIHGREIVDTMFLAVKYDVGRKYVSYGLKPIIEHEGLEVVGRQFYDASLIRKNYQTPVEWVKIKKYAEHDADDSLSLYDLMLPSFFYMTQKIPKSLQEIICSATGSQINSMMVRSYLQNNKSLPRASETEYFMGAISIGNPGIYNNVNKVDVASLYPSIMIQYQIFDNQKDPEGNFKALVNTLTEQRLAHKKLAKTDKYYDDLQSSEKILINSCYGFLGAPGLLFNSPKNASLVTEYGRKILEQSMKWVEDKGFVLSNADTDAVSYCKEDMSYISKEERQILLDELNSIFPEKITFEADGYFPRMVILKAKNYIMLDEKGKTTIKGSALKSSKTETALKEFLETSISALLDQYVKPIEGLISREDILKSIYGKYVTEILNVREIKRWSSKKSITQKILQNTRTNEAKIRDAITGSEHREGDKIWVYFKNDDSLCLVENFDGIDYNKGVLLKKLYKTSQVFSSVIDTKSIFINYSLKKNMKTLGLT